MTKKSIMIEWLCFQYFFYPYRLCLLVALLSSRNSISVLLYQVQVSETFLFSSIIITTVTSQVLALTSSVSSERLSMKSDMSHFELLSRKTMKMKVSDSSTEIGNMSTLFTLSATVFPSKLQRLRSVLSSSSLSSQFSKREQSNTLESILLQIRTSRTWYTTISRASKSTRLKRGYKPLSYGVCNS